MFKSSLLQPDRSVAIIQIVDSNDSVFINYVLSVTFHKSNYCSLAESVLDANS